MGPPPQRHWIMRSSYSKIQSASASRVTSCFPDAFTLVSHTASPPSDHTCKLRSVHPFAHTQDMQPQCRATTTDTYICTPLLCPFPWSRLHQAAV